MREACAVLRDAVGRHLNDVITRFRRAGHAVRWMRLEGEWEVVE